jgi:hypothetical protein
MLPRASISGQRRNARPARSTLTITSRMDAYGLHFDEHKASDRRKTSHGPRIGWETVPCAILQVSGTLGKMGHLESLHCGDREDPATLGIDPFAPTERFKLGR